MSLVTSCLPSSGWLSSSKSKVGVSSRVQLLFKNWPEGELNIEICVLQGLCEVSQQQNETQSVGTASTMSQHGLVQQQQQQQQHPGHPPVADHQHQSTVVSGGQVMGGYVSDASMTTLVAAATSLGVAANSSVVSMSTMTQPLGHLVSPTIPLQQQQQGGRPTYPPSYRGRPRGRRPSGTTSGPGRGAWAGGNGGEKRTAAAAGLNAAGGVRRPTRGTYRGSWPSNRSPSKASPTGSNQSTVHGSNHSQGGSQWFYFPPVPSDCFDPGIVLCFA